MNKLLIFAAFQRHILLCALSIGLGTITAVSLGTYLYYRPRAAALWLGLTGALQTVPSLALYGLLLPVLGIGILPAVTALTLYSLTPILRATLVSLREVDPVLIEAARGIGMSRRQILRRILLPLAMPGILTGTIIGMAHALGETAPLLLIGMVAFVRDYPAAPPEGFFDPASALPVQVYNFTRRADPAYLERASGAIIVLLVFLLAMNIIAVLLRRKFERRW